MQPSFEQFRAALRSPGLRTGIGLQIAEDDALALLAHDDWARDYYAQWISLFPVEVPTTRGSEAPGQERRLGLGAQLALVGVLAALIAVAGVALIVPTLNGGSRALTTTVASHPTPTATTENGLTSAETELMNASLAPSRVSIDQALAGGMTLTQLRDAADLYTGEAKLICQAAAKLPAGFDTAGLHEKTVAGIEQGITALGKTVTPSPVEAERIWTATVAYCASTK